MQCPGGGCCAIYCCDDLRIADRPGAAVDGPAGGLGGQLEDGIIQLFVGDIGRLVNVDRVGVVKAATGRLRRRGPVGRIILSIRRIWNFSRTTAFIWNFFPYNSDDLPAIPCGG